MSLAYRAIQNGANFIAEGFLFSVAASLILLETWRTSHQRNQNSSRTTHLETDVKELEEGLADMKVCPLFLSPFPFIFLLLLLRRD